MNVLEEMWRVEAKGRLGKRGLQKMLDTKNEQKWPLVVA